MSGPKLCLGSTKDAKILPAFLHSPRDCELVQERREAVKLTPHGGRQRVVDTERHCEGLTGTEDIDGSRFLSQLVTCSGPKETSTREQCISRDFEIEGVVREFGSEVGGQDDETLRCGGSQ